MAFKKVQDLDCDVTISLGGRDSKTGKPNPTQIEGYYLGSKTIPSRKAKSGFSKLHILQTPKGNVGVWGKTDLDRKMASVTPGNMIRATQNGKINTPNGEMYKYEVEFDSENSIEVNLPQPTASVSDDTSYGSTSSFSGEEMGDTGLDEDDAALDEVVPTRTPARQSAALPNANAQSKVKASLAGVLGKTRQ